MQLRPDCPQLADLGWTQYGRQWPSFQTRAPIFSRPGYTRFSGEGCVLGSRRAWPGTTPAWLCSFDLHSWAAVSSKDTSLPLWNLPAWPFISSEGWSSPFSSCLGQETHAVRGLGQDSEHIPQPERVWGMLRGRWGPSPRPAALSNEAGHLGLKESSQSCSTAIPGTTGGFFRGPQAPILLVKLFA